ncbi:hypothetical protein AOQ84DRAFT_288945 [Glonium stellatum]|uniref:Uncharacterized protein n=1 Tax=Glonium stellatum TaxID=574774 RepID=A0A8E2JUX2_9PEZI|nr:hypothetical protein AOQ84DRAFT_288945 [Glonium stellatum]
MLRPLTIITFPPAFILLLVHGIVFSYSNPAMGLLPLSVSSAFGAVVFYYDRKRECESPSIIQSPALFAIDLGIGVGLLISLILTWVFLRGERDGSSVMLGTYASGFLLINFSVHLFFVVQHLHEWFSDMARSTYVCPHCNYTPSAGCIDASGYVPVKKEEEQNCYDYRAVDNRVEQSGGHKDMVNISNASNLV